MKNQQEEIKVTRVIHRGWLEFEQVCKLKKFNFGDHFPRMIFGKYQYFIESKNKGKYSIVELPDYFGDGVTLWELADITNDKIDVVGKFGSRDHAIEEAKKYLMEK